MAQGKIGWHMGSLGADRLITQHAENGVATGTITQVMNNSGANYCKMPDGTLIQWGTEFYSGSIQPGGVAQATVTFPISFADVTEMTIFVSLLTSQPAFRTATPASRGRASVNINIQNNYTSAAEGATFLWFAIGRWK